MLVDHVHFYVQDSTKTCTYLKNIGFILWDRIINKHTQTEILHHNHNIFFLISSSLNPKSPVYHYLNKFASGVADVAFQVENIDSIIHQLSSLKDDIISYPYTYCLPEGKIKIAKVKGFGSVEHTLIENDTQFPFVYLLSKFKNNNGLDNININNINQPELLNHKFDHVDHVVLNVNKGELREAVQFYCQAFGFKILQKFDIKTDQSGLLSKALLEPNNNFYFNINEPIAESSQIQEFIDFNGGAGIQHIAIHTHNIIETVHQIRNQGINFLPMLDVYYQQLKKYGRNRIIPNLTRSEWEAIEEQNILVDLNQINPESLLMQIFTKPIFKEPTFFFEFIERRKQSQGFGEGNFQALFELIEKQQIARNQKS